MALSRLAYQSDNATVTYHSDNPMDPTAGSETVYAAPVPVPLHEAHRRRAELLRRIFEVEPLEYPRCCCQTMRIVAFITAPRAIDGILDHLRRTATARRRSRAPSAQGMSGCGVGPPGWERSGTAGVRSSHWLDASSTKGDTWDRGKQIPTRNDEDVQENVPRPA